ncbi:hypothetical protein BC567DRAFT_231515 [Phyllosticta citribraziliensis]
MRFVMSFAQWRALGWALVYSRGIATCSLGIGVAERYAFAAWKYTLLEVFQMNIRRHRPSENIRVTVRGRKNVEEKMVEKGVWD